MNSIEILNLDHLACLYIPHVSDTGIDNVWLGLQDYVHEGRWVWNSNKGQPSYTNWAPGEPNNSKAHEGGEDCVQLYGSTGKWDDAWCEQVYDAREKISIACEME